MKIDGKKFFLKFLTVLKWFFWIAGVIFFSAAEKLYFVIPFILAVACGLLIKTYVRRFPGFLITAVCVLLGDMFMLLLRLGSIPASLVLLVSDVLIPAGLLFWCMRKPAKPRIIVLMVYLFFAFLLDSRLSEAFDPTGLANRLGFDQMIVKVFLTGFLITGLRKLRQAFRSVNAASGGLR